MCVCIECYFYSVHSIFIACATGYGDGDCELCMRWPLHTHTHISLGFVCGSGVSSTELRFVFDGGAPSSPSSAH